MAQESSRLKLLRESLNLTIKQVAVGSGLNESFYRKMELGQISITERSAEKLSNFFQMEIKPCVVKTDLVVKKEFKNLSIKEKLVTLTIDSYKNLNKYLKLKCKRRADFLIYLYSVIQDIDKIVENIEVEEISFNDELNEDPVEDEELKDEDYKILNKELKTRSLVLEKEISRLKQILYEIQKDCERMTEYIPELMKYQNE